MERELKNKEKKKEKYAKLKDERILNTKSSFALSKYVGTFTDKMYGTAEVKLENGTLVFYLLPNPDMVGDLTHWHYDTFEVTWRKQFAWFAEGKVQFIMNNKGKIEKLGLDVPNEDFWFDELDFRKVAKN